MNGNNNQQDNQQGTNQVNPTLTVLNNKIELA